MTLNNRSHIKSKSLLLSSASLALMAAFSAPSLAQDEEADVWLEEVTVTATKRATSTQDIPVAITALGEKTLKQTHINVFTDYLLQLPSVSSGGTGPAQHSIYIRGLSSTTPDLAGAGVAGLAPNVALYLDEQPVTQVGRNLDVYAADLNRIEVLPGSQGTLFGASSQAGTIRLITNKPVLDEFSARLAGGYAFTEGGDESTKVEGVINFPVTDNLAIRSVFYTDDQGGYIDNRRGELSARESARFQSSMSRPNGTLTENGFQSTANLTGVTFLNARNDDLVEKNFNDVSYEGVRLSALYTPMDDMTVTVSHMRQTMESEGVFFIDPELDDPNDLSIQRYAADDEVDHFANTALQIEALIGDLEVVYAGAYLERETDQTMDYTDYLFIGQYLPYYICDAAVTYPGSNDPSGTCQMPQMFVDSTTATKISTHELRFITPADLPYRLTAGVFYSNQKLVEQNNFTYPGSINAESFTPGVYGWPQNEPLPGSSVTNPDPRPRGVIFFNDVTRTDNQLGFFGEFSYDISEKLTTTIGLRYHDVDVRLKGSANSSFYNFGGEDVNAFGANLDELFDGTQVRNGVAVPKSAVAKGWVLKGNVSYRPTETSLVYFNYSQGFRPGLPNRPAGAGGGAVPGSVETDEVTNYEFGWKMDLLNKSLRFNGAAFYVDVKDLQTTIFDPQVTNLLFSDNAANAVIKGLEGDVTWATKMIPGLVLSSSFTFLDTEIKELVGASVAIAGPGEQLSNAPSFQGTFRGRYSWDLNEDFLAHAQLSATYSGSSYSDIVLINRAKQNDYLLMNGSVGLQGDAYSLTAYVDNLTNTRAQLFNNQSYGKARVTINRPRTIGLRFAVDF
ncbi:TonB-dependent receptor [Temperatibacter marinus]|uniref:TonB-dependent receptor n=1 Tax=Temperatibacter marinus TaxID=1456591 RepID=A0AA52EKW8_9PROT|nr:TonB-dependent receptor [Temperatibacter marinus]WND03896.1 TonB-dependent receptor [Temperatibacter marinus]